MSNSFLSGRQARKLRLRTGGDDGVVVVTRSSLNTGRRTGLFQRARDEGLIDFRQRSHRPFRAEIMTRGRYRLSVRG
jgi:hypothetical protein